MALSFDPLPRSFFDRPPEMVAPELLGKILVRILEGDVLAGYISETEAYLPFEDQAAHGFKPRKHTESLFKEGGHAYVHAMRHHVLLDVVTQKEDKPGSVLIRGIVPTQGTPYMMRLRRKTVQEGLTNGPGKVCQALAITRAHDGTDLTSVSSELFIAYSDQKVDPLQIKTTTRIGITKAQELPLRFCL